MCSWTDFPPYDAPLTMPDAMFIHLDPEAEARFRGWARDNHAPGTFINPLWHPVVRDECARIDAEATEGRQETR